MSMGERASIVAKTLRGWAMQGKDARTLTWESPVYQPMGMEAFIKDGFYGLAGFAGHYIVIDRHRMPVDGWENLRVLGVVQAIKTAEELQRKLDALPESEKQGRVPKKQFPVVAGAGNGVN